MTNYFKVGDLIRPTSLNTYYGLTPGDIYRVVSITLDPVGTQLLDIAHINGSRAITSVNCERFSLIPSGIAAPCTCGARSVGSSRHASYC